MNQCVPLAHYGACSAGQRTSGLRQRQADTGLEVPYRPLAPLPPPEKMRGRSDVDGDEEDGGDEEAAAVSGGASLR